MTRRSILAALIGLLAAGQALSRPDTMRVNVREGCRQAVAGAYLKVYDERERLKTYIKATTDQAKDLRLAANKTKSELRKIEKSMQERAFEVDIATRRDETAATLRAYEAQIKDAERLTNEAATALDQQTKAEKELRTAIDRVFIFKRTEDKPDGGYPEALTYRSACPKYRYLCPLPSKDVENLLRIKPNGEAPEECQRYASLSKIR